MRPIRLAVHLAMVQGNPREAILGISVGCLLLVLAIGGPLVAVRQSKLAVREAAARQQADEESQRARTVYREAAAQYTKAFELLEELVASTPKDSGHRRKLAAIYNELAWFLVVSPDLKLRDPPHAVQLAEMAVQQTGSDATCWRTLGAAQYRMERWKECIDALEKSRSLTAEPAPCELLFMAMAHGNSGRTMRLGRATRSMPPRQDIRASPMTRCGSWIARPAPCWESRNPYGDNRDPRSP